MLKFAKVLLIAGLLLGAFCFLGADDATGKTQLQRSPLADGGSHRVVDDEWPEGDADFSESESSVLRGHLESRLGVESGDDIALRLHVLDCHLEFLAYFLILLLLELTEVVADDPRRQSVFLAAGAQL